MSWSGEWYCRSCQYLNFKKRSSCQLCGEPKCGDRSDYGNLGGRSGSSSAGCSGSNVLPGDWYCSVINCGAHNYASKPSCFKCGTLKDESASARASDMARSRVSGYGDDNPPGWKAGDWKCTSCNEHNFASRMECYRCNAPRDFGNCNILYKEIKNQGR